MSPCRNLLSSLPILVTALFFVLAPVGIVAQSSGATCLPAFDWMINSKSQNPCLVAAYLLSVCAVSPISVPAIPPNYHYNGPYANGQSTCECNSVTYNAFSACALCQNATETNWSLWSFNCSTTYPGFYPPGIPSGTALPQWMFQDVMKTDVFNATLAQSVGDLPESTANQAQSTPTPTPPSTPTPTPSGGGSKIGAIVGGVVGGVVGLLFIVGLTAFLLKKYKKPPQPQSPMTVHIPSAVYTEGTSFGLSDADNPDIRLSNERGREGWPVNGLGI
ncbi:hypothetical protein EV363DRAFT_858627 [Boletus edulis]|nr:hypothetical protein EV363DRAFT_858627 [Boletus edulis]